MGEANTVLACALRGKPCKRITQEEVARVYTKACLWQGPEDYEGAVVTVENEMEFRLRGNPAKPWCDACPLHKLEEKPVRHMTIVHPYCFYGAEVPRAGDLYWPRRSLNFTNDACRLYIPRPTAPAPTHKDKRTRGR